MLFTNAIIYRFTKPVPWTLDELQQALEENEFNPCGANDSYQLGWVAPAPKIGSSLLYQSGRYVLLALKKEEKILPASVIKEEVEERASVVEDKEQRKLRKSEVQELKEQVVSALLPRAFSKKKTTFAFIDMDKGLLVVDTSSPNKADEFTSFLRQSTSTLPIRFIALNDAPTTHFSDWIKSNYCPSPFETGDQCELKASDGTDTVIRCKGSESLSEVIAGHIEGGMDVTQLAMIWDDKLGFVLGEDTSIKRIKYLDTFKDSLDESEDDAAAQFEANFSLMTLEFDALLKDILEALGGEDTSALVN